MMDWVLSVLGFAVLMIGANFLVDGASSIGRKLNVSSAVIGLTIVSFGTSAPELVISLLATTRGSTDLAIANVLGSNLFNTLLIVGIAAMILPIRASSNVTFKEVPFSLLAALILGLLANDIFIDRSADNVISRTDGLILLAFFAVFSGYSIDLALKSNSDADNTKVYAMWKSLFMFVGGLAGLFFGGRWMVTGVTGIAVHYGMSEALVGVTIVATATSLPELATSVIAALKGNTGIALGNAIGSNIFNIFLVLGISATVSPLPFRTAMNLDIGLVAIASLLVMLMILMGKGKVISRTEGGAFAALYLMYIAYTVMNV